MYNAAEQFAELNKANVAQASKLAALALENAEKVAKLNLMAAKAALAQGVEGAEAAASVKDVQELFALRSKYTEAGVQTALAYSRNVYELASEHKMQKLLWSFDSVGAHSYRSPGWAGCVCGGPGHMSKRFLHETNAGFKSAQCPNMADPAGPGPAMAASDRLHDRCFVNRDS